VLGPSKDDAISNWPVLTGASRDSIEIFISEVKPRSARAVLQVGGETLINDSRNKSHKDYAPYIEFNGSPSGRGQMAIRNAIYGRDTEIRQAIHARVAALVKDLTG
jgi:hypothetical protein